MCVIFFYANSNPGPAGYKLILASNRDEFFERKTQTAAKWANAEHVYGGIDMEPGREGGTWLAIGGKNGIYKIGALLNLTGEPKPRNAIGRGMIVADFVNSTYDSYIDKYNQDLVSDCAKYTAFNFVSIEIGDPTKPASILHCSNVPPSITKFDEGLCYGFGNSLPETPFQKVHYGRKRFEEIVNNLVKTQNKMDPKMFKTTQEKLIEDLFELLKCKRKFWPDVELNRRAPNWGEYLSALNVSVDDESYGSRTHTIILIDNNDVMHFIEETMAGNDPDGEWIKTHIEKNIV
ncbi:transport and Golgi organization protein 2 isoform X2 [Teleopsis dalmanni]|uniref:transport and Golgi organization protein 2 isoform X2 n=1 Tax=Teleopsis dalmanni TaxID=139649 RepID=UPI000D32CE0B|nr:transport and Golgi organization protein 2 isoform X2 [Teleopsis dalmanni]